MHCPEPADWRDRRAQSEEDGEMGGNTRCIAVGEAVRALADVERMADLPAARSGKSEQFFVSYNEQEGKRFEVGGRRGQQRRSISSRRVNDGSLAVDDKAK